ncbi:gag-pol protein, partial [Lasius niger]
MSMDMDCLILAQDDLQNRMASTIENLNKLGKANITVEAIEVRLNRLEKIWEKFEKRHDELRATYWEDLKTSEYIKGDFAGLAEETYLSQKTKLLKMKSALPVHHASGNSAGIESSSARQRTTLPRIQLPHFSGKYADWPPFRDLFRSVIGMDTSISDVEKLHYLKASLKGEAELLVRNLSTISENYQRAWNLLLEHYENKRLLLRSYFSAFTALPKMKNESASEMKRILQCVVSTVGALESIERPIASCEDLFVHLIVELLDARSRRDWEDVIGGTSEPATYAEVKEFLEKRMQTLEALHPQKPEAASAKSGDAGTRSTRAHHAQKQEVKRGRCSLCKKDHFLMLCDGYKEKSPEERKKHVEANQLCLNCLGKHQVSECQSKKNCSACQGRHHTSVHDACRETTSTSHVAHQPRLGRGAVLLATARVRVADKFGGLHVARALIDQGSEASMISEALTQRLRLPRNSAAITVFGVGGTQTGTSNGRVSLRVLPRVAGSPMTISALILPRLTVYTGATAVRREPWKHLHGLELADPDFQATDPVDILLGADVYAAILDSGVIKGGPREPIAQRTSLGWILSGAIEESTDRTAAHSHSCVVDETLVDLVRRLWEQEEVPRNSPPRTSDELECEELFARTHSRDETGRYVVRLPLTDDTTDFSGTRIAARRLLSCMESRFARDLRLHELYQEFMHEYERLDHMSPVDSRETTSAGRVCYLPHHGVMKSVDEKPKLRVVFNGSSPLPSGTALNNGLRVGPNLLPALPDILTRWRLHKHAMATDIEKMYRQILVHPADRDLQRIVWRRNSTESIQEYRLNTVTYGLACAPFLAIRSLLQLANDEEDRYPLGATALRRNVYVDDILVGADSLSEARELKRQLIQICRAGGFPLKKWSATDPELLEDIPATDKMRADLRVWEPHESHSMLGLRWHPGIDSFSFALREIKSQPTTKRAVLSLTAQLFDPLGWLAPVVVRAKILIQSVWLQGLDWDTPLAPRDAEFWASFKADLLSLDRIRVPRWLSHQAEDSIELHGFADASERAFAAVLYIRAIGSDGSATVSLVAAKSKVAPVKQVSLPRLELCAAALLASLVHHHRTVIELPITGTHLWSDSTVTLAWIQGHPARWKTYVANRVAEIQRIAPEAHWHHTPGGDNPADCASRGLSPSDLASHELWWKGPLWLTTTTGSWPAGPAMETTMELPEQRTSSHAAFRQRPDEPAMLTRHSSLHRLLRVSAWCRRWLRPQSAREPTLTVDELQAAEDAWIRVSQAWGYPTELAALSGGRELPGKSPLLKFNPFVDGKGIMRVGGRLKNASLSHDEKHPVILPSESHLTRLFIEASHRRTLHGGVQSTLGLLRQHFWIPRGRACVKEVIHRCVTCLRWRAATPQPAMGDLPRPRVTPSRPFQHTGVDYAGPIFLRTTKGRGHKSTKAFIAVFVCMSTKAVHLDVASDYTADAFLAALRRFIARRGLCEVMYSDCGTNFAGADRQLRGLFTASSKEGRHIADELARDRIRWKFNPPAAPHFGGLWEAAVKALKRHLRRVIG